MLTKVTPSPNFDSYPGLSPIIELPPPQEESSGQSSTPVSSSLVTPSSATPQSDACPPFPGCGVINNPQIKGMPWAPCWEETIKRCPPPTPKPRPESGVITISGVKNHAVDEKGRFKGFTGNGVVATLYFTAERPGRATLQFAYSGPAATDDSNVTGFLADQPAALQKPQERLLVAPEPFTVEVVSSVTATPTPRPTIVPPTPTPTVSPTPTFTPTPTPTPEPRVTINFRLQLEGRKSHATIADIYGISTIYAQPSKEVLQLLGSGGSTAVVGSPVLPSGRIDKLGTILTNTSGVGTLTLDRTHVGAAYVFLVQTPSHLRKAAQNYQAIRLDVGQNPACIAEICTQEVKYVDFGMLTAGDVYTDEKGNKDTLVNTFDVGALFAAWSGASVVGKDERPNFLAELPVPADLNGDGVVNNRDLAMLLTNFNKRGDK